MKATNLFYGLKAMMAFIVLSAAFAACGPKHSDTTVPNPEVTIAEATNVSVTSVTLTALITPNDASATVSFEITKAGTTNWQTQPISLDLNGKNLKNKIQITCNPTGLVAGTDYIARAKAVTTGNSPIVTNEVTFTTAAGIIDGKIFHQVVIGNQTWMVENLRTTKYQNGDPIATSASPLVCFAATSGMYCWYDNDPNANTDYGLMYNWPAVNDSRKIAPVGWHIPTFAEFMELRTFLGGNNAGLEIMEKGSDHWTSQTPTVTNSSGLTLLPGGIYYKLTDNSTTLVFNGKGLYADYWTSSSYDVDRAIFFDLSGNGLVTQNQTLGTKNFFCSVRVIKDK